MKPQSLICSFVALALVVCNFAPAQDERHVPEQDPVNVPAALEDISSIVVSIRAPELVSESLSEQLKGSVEQELKSAHLPLFVPEPNVMYKLPIMSVLTVAIEGFASSDPNQYFWRLQTSLSRQVRLVGRRAVGFSADVWKSEPTAFIGNLQEFEAWLTDAALGQVKDFAKACSAAKTRTPGSAQSPPTHSTAEAIQKWSDPNKAQIVTEYSYVASKKSKVFHRPDCPSVKQINANNLVGYNTRDEAIQAGKRPCKICKP